METAKKYPYNTGEKDVFGDDIYEFEPEEGEDCEETNDGRSGGVLDGDFHSAPSGGIKAVVVTDNNAPVLLEKDEVIINRKSVSDPTERTLTGTNKELLSIINESGGGVPIMATGGEIKSNQPEQKNKYSGYDYINPEELERAKGVDLLTLPALVSGTNCSNCLFFSNNFCTNEKIKLPVNYRMCCCLWTNSDVLRSWEESKEDGGEIKNKYPNRGNGGRASRKIKFDYDFFNKRTPEVAYWAGFIMADGCLEDKIMGNRRYNRLSLSLADEDKGHVAKFCESIQCDSEFMLPDETKIGQNKTRICLFYNGITDSLLYWGIIPNKTYNFIEPQVSIDLLPDFLRGWFDGDGNIHCIGLQNRFRITGNMQAVEWYAAALRKLGFEGKIRFERSESVWGRLYIDGKENIQKILKIINGECATRLERKYCRIENKIKNGMKDIETNSPNKNDMENTNSDETLKGGRADGKAIWDIAIKFNVPIDYAMEQLDKGLEEEKEHTPDFKTRYEIALDHLYDDIEYYNRLKTIERMAKGGEIKVTEGNYPSGAELWRVSQKNTNDVGIFQKKFYPTKESAISAYKIKLERQNDLPEEIYIEKDTDLLPKVIAQAPAEKFAEAKLRSKYGQLTQANDEEYKDEVRDFGNYLVARAEFHYQNQPQFKKHVRASGNKGRDYLIMFMNHWAAIGSDNKSNWKSAERSKKEWLEAYNKGVIAEEPDYLLNFDEYISKHGISKSKEALAKKTYLQSIKEAAEKNLYQQAILQGEISAIKAQNILEEAGLYVPEEIREATAEEVEEIAEELDEIKEKRMKEAQEFENFKKQAIIAEPMTKETTKAEVLESLEALKVSYDLSSGKEKELIGEAVEAMQVMYDSMPDVLCCGGYVLKQDGETITETYN